MSPILKVKLPSEILTIYIFFYDKTRISRLNKFKVCQSFCHIYILIQCFDLNWIFFDEKSKISYAETS